MQQEHIKVLLVEDNPADARLVQEMLADSVNCTFDFNHAKNIAITNSYLDKYQFDVLLLDLSLPDSNGLESLDGMVSINPDLPIVVLTCLDDEQMAIDAVQHGAQDYLVKGQGGAALLTRALRYAIERKRTEQRLSYLAQYDALTNLPNRALFWDRLKQAIKHASRTNKKGALMFLDLDLFKNINDTLGHSAGDKLLAALALRLKKCIREVDTVARLGGDEFTIILNEVDNKIDATLVAKKITQIIKQPITIDNQEVFISTSIGITLFANSNDLPDTLIKHADMALYAAKEKGRGSYLYYEDKMDKRVTKRINMINDLRFALDRNEFRLHYQPQIDLASGKLIGMEALIRWQHPKRGLLPPAKFVHLLEETGLVVKVGDWILSEACRQTNLWHEKKLGRLRIAVNLSSRQFHEKNLLKCIKKALSDSQLPPGYLQIEVTESTLMTNSRESIVILKELRELGIQLSIDDFGTGFSSLSYLRLFSFQALKIDQSFVKEISTHSDVEKIITAVISLAHSLDMQVVAEGVELEQQLPFLVQNGCDEVQGYLFSKPMSADDCTVWLNNNKTNKITFISVPAVELKPKKKEHN